MQFIKYHWFGLVISLIVTFFLFIFVLVLIAPHQDEQKRGFVPCTEAMAEQIKNCSSRSLCVLGSVVDNTFCNIKVIGKGVKLWIKGEQSSPWKNYLFVADIKNKSATDDVEPEESLKEYYESQPDLELEMNELKKLNQQLENNGND